MRNLNHMFWCRAFSNSQLQDHVDKIITLRLFTLLCVDHPGKDPILLQ